MNSVLRNPNIYEQILKKMPTKSKSKNATAYHEAILGKALSKPSRSKAELSRKTKKSENYTWYKGNVILNHVPNGFGRRYYNKDTYYEGMFKHGKKHGKYGVFVTKTHILVSTFKNDFADGKCLIILRKPYPLTYYQGVYRPGYYYSVGVGIIRPKLDVKKNPRSWLFDRHDVPYYHVFHESDLGYLLAGVKKVSGELVMKHVSNSMTNGVKERYAEELRINNES